MTQNNITSNGGKLKETINTAVQQLTREQAREKCIEAVSQYRERIAAKVSGESLLDAVYCFYKQDQYPDNIYEYSYYATVFLEAMAKPEVNEVLKKHLGDYAMRQMPAILWELHNFSARLEHEAYRTLFEEYEMNAYTSADDKTSEEWQKIEDKYKRLLYSELVKDGTVPIG